MQDDTDSTNSTISSICSTDSATCPLKRNSSICSPTAGRRENRKIPSQKEQEPKSCQPTRLLEQLLNNGLVEKRLRLPRPNIQTGFVDLVLQCVDLFRRKSPAKIVCRCRIGNAMFFSCFDNFVFGRIMGGRVANDWETFSISMRTKHEHVEVGRVLPTILDVIECRAAAQKIAKCS